ncbi:MAG: exodeoxyribonuclease VII small subunit [Anaerovoracaceae bacterium]|jgi:exodeoxyribonuclease VII small subunit
MKETNKLSFEEALKKLEETAANLEKDHITLDEAIKSYEQGIVYYNQCEEILKNASQKIETVKDKV